MDLTDRHYLVTGASSGIGRAVAVLLARLGASLSLVDINGDGLTSVAAELSGEHHVYPFDLSDIDGVQALVKSAVAAGGKLNGVVHAAGIQRVTPIRVLKKEVWREVFAVNTEAGLALAKSLGSKRVYAGSDGAIVFMSSVVGVNGSPGAIAYAMSKSALHGITKSMALELAPKGVRVNCVAPGFVKTPLLEKTSQLWTDEQRAAVEASHPLGFGEPEDVANAVAFLVADTGRWITGTVLAVDGGYLAQ